MAEDKSFFKFQHVEKVVNNSGGFGGVYFLAFLGSAYYFIQNSTSFWDGVVGIIKAIIWPAVIMYEVLKLLQL